MSSTNEEISAPPKPKTSPLEFRNTDLVSRLLAATPPYLYNMPLVPHSYFFSEMLRSLVQGKTEAAARMPSAAPHRRSRKRTWSQGRVDHYSPKQMSPNPKCENQDMPPPNWTPKMTPEKHGMFDNKYDKGLERPLELTMNKTPLNNNTKLCHTETQSEIRHNEMPPHKTLNSPSTLISSDKPDSHPGPNGHVPMMFPSMPSLPPQDASTDLILPPPPPIWYPPLYPAPYGIDPLHFFIDLRVSGHIYDRKNSKEHPNVNMNMPPSPNTQMNHLGVGNPMGHVLEMNGGGINPASSSMTSMSESINNFNAARDSLVKQPRHTSAFSVPTPSLNRNDPLNLSGNKYHSQQKMPRHGDEKLGKFDIKSMGFDRNTDNNTSTNYIFKNLPRIYKDVNETKYNEEGIDLTSPKHEIEPKDDIEVNVKDEVTDNKDDEKENDKEKRCKDLRALIGLELVVDYVKHEVKPSKHSNSEESTTDVDSRASSPAVEVVTLPDIENRI